MGMGFVCAYAHVHLRLCLCVGQKSVRLNRCVILFHCDSIFVLQVYILLISTFLNDNGKSNDIENDDDKTSTLTVAYNCRSVCSQALCKKPRHRRAGPAKCVQLRGESVITEGRVSAVSRDFCCMETSD